MLSWIRKRVWPSPGEKFANSVLQSLDWWMLGLDSRCSDRFRKGNLTELTQMRVEGQSIRAGTSMLANVVAGETILLRNEKVRNETLAYLRVPEVTESLLYFKSSDRVMMMDLLESAPSATSSMLDDGVREEMLRAIFQGASDIPLSADAKTLFVGIRHLWERAIVAVNFERENTYLRDMVSRLADDCLYALEGMDSDSRSNEHLTKALRKAIDRSSEARSHNDVE